MRTRLFPISPLLLLVISACASRGEPAGKGSPVRDDEKHPPSEQPQGGWGPLEERMKGMIAEAETIIDRARASSGDATTRYRLAALEIHFAMRDEFGPANGALFNARDNKLQELAGAVGMTSTPEPIAFPVDDMVRETRSFAEQIRAAGYRVNEAPVLAHRILWTPGDAVGWELVVSDPKRTVDEDVPYSGTPHGPPKAATPAKVHPTIHVYVFPHVRMSATQSMVRREQPGEPFAAGSATVLFRLQDAQSRDQDPGGTIGKAVEAAIFREPTRKELPMSAKALGGGTAILERGLLRVTGRGEPPAPLPELGLPEARILLWTVQQGADIDHTLLPLR